MYYIPYFYFLFNIVHVSIYHTGCTRLGIWIHGKLVHPSCLVLRWPCMSFSSKSVHILCGVVWNHAPCRHIWQKFTLLFYSCTEFISANHKKSQIYQSRVQNQHGILQHQISILGVPLVHILYLHFRLFWSIGDCWYSHFHVFHPLLIIN